jgi:hypothetical protein
MVVKTNQAVYIKDQTFGFIKQKIGFWDYFSRHQACGNRLGTKYICAAMLGFTPCIAAQQSPLLNRHSPQFL